MVSGVIERACWAAHSSFCQSGIPPTKPDYDALIGGLAITSVRRLISPLRRSIAAWSDAAVGRSGVGEHIGLGLVEEASELGQHWDGAGRQPFAIGWAASRSSLANAVAMKAETTRRPLRSACVKASRPKR